MAAGNVYRERTSLLAFGLMLVTILGGVLLIGVAESLPASTWAWFKSLLVELGGLLIISGGLGGIWELRLKRAFVEEILDAGGISHEIQVAKLSGVTTKFMTGVPWTKLIDSSKELDMMVTAGQTWRNTYEHNLRELAARPNAKINIILPDPTDPEVVHELSRRFGYTNQLVIDSIGQAEKFFKNLADRAGMPKGSLKIFYIKEAPLYTFYRLDNLYIFASYRHFAKGDIVTLVSHKGGCIADFIDEQLNQFLGRKCDLARQAFPTKDASLTSGVVRADTSNVPTESAESSSVPPESQELLPAHIQSQISTGSSPAE